MSNYYAKSINNKNTLHYLNQKTPDYIEWEVIVIFYTALHLVNDYLHKNGIEFEKNHKGRKKAVKKELTDLYDSYVKLFDVSIRARYYPTANITEKIRNTCRKRLSEIESKLSGM